MRAGRLTLQGADASSAAALHEEVRRKKWSDSGHDRLNYATL